MCFKALIYRFFSNSDKNFLFLKIFFFWWVGVYAFFSGKVPSYLNLLRSFILSLILSFISSFRLFSFLLYFVSINNCILFLRSIIFSLSIFFDSSIFILFDVFKSLIILSSFFTDFIYFCFWFLFYFVLNRVLSKLNVYYYLLIFFSYFFLVIFY